MYQLFDYFYNRLIAEFAYAEEFEGDASLRTADIG
jgi:hypothetical protein